MTTTQTTTRTAPLYRVTEISDHECILRTRGGAEIQYWRPSSGGYVRRVTDARPGTLGWQVCDGLAGSGSTLHQSERGNLATLIRREARTAAGRWQIERIDADHRDRY